MKGILITFLSVLAIAGGIMLQQSQRIFAVAPEVLSTNPELQELIADTQVTIDRGLLLQAINGNLEALRYVAFCYEEGLEGVQSDSAKAYKYKTQTEGIPLGAQLSERLKVSRANKNAQLDKFKGIVPEFVLNRAKAVATDGGWRYFGYRSALQSIASACEMGLFQPPEGMTQASISRLCYMDHIPCTDSNLNSQKKELMDTGVGIHLQKILRYQKREKTRAEEAQMRQGIFQSLQSDIKEAPTLEQIPDLYAKIRNSRLSAKNKNELEWELALKFSALISPEKTQQQGNEFLIVRENVSHAQDVNSDEVPDIAELPSHQRGIVNVGNSCFLNSVIQQLYRAPDFRQHLMHLRNPVSISELKGMRDNNFRIYYNLMQIFHVLDQADPDKPVEIKSFVNAIRMSLYCGADADNIFRQQDADEFMRQICARVGFDLSIRTVQGGNPMHCAVNVANVGEGKSLLNALVSSFGLSAQNKFRVSLPQTMMITLQRFISRDDGQTEKLNYKISLDDEIDLAEHCMDEITGSKRYRLVGIVVHRGPTAFSGHYVSYVRDREQWYLLNDETVTPIVGSIDDIGELKTDAYILRYERI